MSRSQIALVLVGLVAALPSAFAQDKKPPLITLNRVQLNLAGAEAVLDAAKKKAVSLGLKCNIAVVDDGGHLLAFARMDGARPASAATALAKAVSAATFRQETGPLPAKGEPNVLLSLSLQAASGGKITALKGGGADSHRRPSCGRDWRRRRDWRAGCRGGEGRDSIAARSVGSIEVTLRTDSAAPTAHQPNRLVRREGYQETLRHGPNSVFACPMDVAGHRFPTKVHQVLRAKSSKDPWFVYILLSSTKASRQVARRRHDAGEVAPPGSRDHFGTNRGDRRRAEQSSASHGHHAGCRTPEREVIRWTRECVAPLARGINASPHFRGCKSTALHPSLKRSSSRSSRPGRRR